MKQFKASEFISNTETPVVCGNGKPVEIITAKGRGLFPVAGYLDNCLSLQTWRENGSLCHDGASEWDLFFTPKNEVVHVFKSNATGAITATLDPEHASNLRCYASSFTYLGTITGPIVPPEVAK